MRDSRVCTDPFPFQHLSLKEAWEYERLSQALNLTGRNAVRYAYLHERRYWPPCDLERMGAA
jgi:hypothetical protein